VRSVKADQVHDDFEITLQRIKPSEGILKLYKEVFDPRANNELGRLNRRIGALGKTWTKSATRGLKPFKSFTEGVITSEEKSELTNLLDVQKIERMSDLKELEEQQSISEADIELLST
jgi:hypothetical protein